MFSTRTVFVLKPLQVTEEFRAHTRTPVGTHPEAAAARAADPRPGADSDQDLLIKKNLGLAVDFAALERR